ncbi:hypothetical protein [Nonomuraea sp. NPDC005692]|uniref:hypothetical protein n=1 Tax=Nonomuraea sp. NPDC005692 TaxID=3157168 RepID=UPI0033EC751B
MAKLAGLLVPGGRVLLSLRHGPVPAGRRMFSVSARETIDLADTHGLELIHRAERVDPHDRQDVVDLAGVPDGGPLDGLNRCGRSWVLPPDGKRLDAVAGDDGVHPRAP